MQATFCIEIGKGVKTAVCINLFNDLVLLAGPKLLGEIIQGMFPLTCLIWSNDLSKRK